MKKQEEQKQEPLRFETAYVMDARLGDRLIAVLQELPIKYSKDIIPLIQELQKAPRADVTLNTKPETP
jgi:hypothetical protein